MFRYRIRAKWPNLERRNCFVTKHLYHHELTHTDGIHNITDESNTSIVYYVSHSSPLYDQCESR